MDKSSSVEMVPKTDEGDTNSEKLQKIEEMKLRVKQLREERIAKHAARVEMLKKRNLEKYSYTPSFPIGMKLSIDHTKPLNGTKLNLPSLHKNLSKDKLDMPSGLPLVSKTTSTIPAIETPKSLLGTLLKNNKYNQVEKKVDTRRSMAPKENSVSSKTFLNKPKFVVQQKNYVSVSDAPKKDFFKSKEVHNTNNLNVTKKFDLSSINRLSKPKFVSKSATTIQDKEKKINNTHSSQQPLQNKRWTLASVDRLSRPKPLLKIPETEKPVNVKKVQKLSSNSSQINGKPKLITKRLTEMHKRSEGSKDDFKEKVQLRRSLSTVHFKHLGADVAKKCVKRTLSVGNMKHKEIEDEISNGFPKDYILPVESERKKSVKFLTPVRKSCTPPVFLNTPRPSELKHRLNVWLQKRGKSLSTYHHLHCFGLHEMNPSIKEKSLSKSLMDDENKENLEIPDDDSFEETTTGVVKDNAAEWRRASYHLVESPAVIIKVPNGIPIVKTCTPQKYSGSIDSTVTGALNDLHHLILEGYSWQQCAEWLHTIVRHCGEEVLNTSSYWECRAALEEKRGDFPRAVECYNKAIIQGAQPVEVEVSLDHLLQKFMKLNLDPEVKVTQSADPKFLDVKNVFKSTLIRFAIQQKNMINESRRRSGSLTSKYVATPVRRSSRLFKPSDATPVSKLDKSLNDKNASGAKPAAVSVLNLKVPFAEKEKTPGKFTPKIPIPMRLQSAKKSTGRKHLVQLCSTLQNVDDEIRNSMVFVPNKALNFEKC